MADLLFTNFTPNPSQTSEIESLPSVMANTETIVASRDFHLTEITVTNKTAVDATFTVKDRQSAPIELFKNVTVPANSTYNLQFRGRWMPAGLTVQASAADSLTFSVRGY